VIPESCRIGDAYHMRFELERVPRSSSESPRVFARADASLTVTTVSRVDDVIVPVLDPATDALVKRELSIELEAGLWRRVVVSVPRADQGMWPCGTALALEISMPLPDGDVWRRSVFFSSSDCQGGFMWEFFEIEPDIDLSMVEDVLIQSSPELALRVFDTRRYWAGTVSVPLRRRAR
jgi:hypothetical protein